MEIALEKDKEISEAAIPYFVPPTFNDGSYVYTHKEKGNSIVKCMTLEPELPSIFEIKIKCIKITKHYVLVGIVNSPFNKNQEINSKGQLGFASNTNVMDNGEWKKSEIQEYKTGDILIIKGNNGNINFAVNDDYETRTYKVEGDYLYFCCYFYQEGDSIEIMT